MNILFIYYKGVQPNDGGLSRITASLTSLFRSGGNQVWLLGVEKNKECDYDSHQLFFPSPHNSKDNLAFFCDICGKYHFDIIINQIPFLHTWIYDVLDECKKTLNYKVISCLHNPVMSQVNNLYFRKGYSLRKCPFLQDQLRKGYILVFLKRIYKLKYRDSYVNMLKHSDKLVVLCDGMYKELQEMLGHCETNKVSIIPNFIEDNNESIDIHKDKNIIWCGNVNFEVKRVDIALRVWERVSKCAPDWNFYILGDGKDLDEAKLLASSLNLNNCYFEGRVDPKPYYKKASFSIISSSYESFSLVTLESLYYGVIPVVFNTFPAASMLIDDKKNGYLVEPYDIEDCASIILRAISDIANLQKMQECAQTSAQKFSKEVIFEKWFDLFKKI